LRDGTTYSLGLIGRLSSTARSAAIRRRNDITEARRKQDVMLPLSGTCIDDLTHRGSSQPQGGKGAEIPPLNFGLSKNLLVGKFSLRNARFVAA